MAWLVVVVGVWCVVCVCCLLFLFCSLILVLECCWFE